MKFTEYVEVNPKTNLKKGEYAPFVEMANVSITYREPEKIENKKYTSGPKFQNGDSVVARIEPCLQNGKKFFWKSDKIGFGSTEYIVFRAKEGKMDSKYLFYLLKTDYIKKSMVSSMVGATGRQRVNNDIFGQIEIVVPNIEKQKKIGRTLFLYDDLIENNQKQIKLLEEATQRLYKEWFVDLRFPGHENTKIVDGVPEGWSRTNINEILTFHRGYDLTKNEMKAGRYPVVGSTTVIGYHNEFKIKGPGIVTGRSGSLGKYQFIWDNFWPHNTSLYISDYKDHNIFFVYSLLQTVDFASLNNGGAIPTLNRNVLSNIEVIEPTDELQEMFAKIAEAQYRKIRNLEKQNNQLKMARDVLLPKLMSGEVEV